MYQNIELFQKKLVSKGIDVAVLRLSQNVLLFSQYWSRNNLSFIVIPAAGNPSVIYPVAEQEDIELANLDHSFPFYDWKISDGDPHDQIAAIFERLSEEYGLAGKAPVIGVENDYDEFAPCYIPGKVYVPGRKTFSTIKKAFGSDRFVSVRDLIVDIMAIKTEFDIEKIKTVNAIAHLAMKEFEKLIEQPGMREIDAASEVECFIPKIACGFNGSRAARGIAQLSSGLKSVDAVCEGVYGDERILQKGDLCLLELAVIVDGYWSDVTRTGCVGGFEGKKAQMKDVVDEAFEAGLKLIRPGALASDIDLATRKVVKQAGMEEYYFASSGHGVGFAYHEDYPILHPESKHVLRQNMVVALEPAVYLPGIGGYRTELNILVRKDDGVVLKD